MSKVRKFCCVLLGSAILFSMMLYGCQKVPKETTEKTTAVTTEKQGSTQETKQELQSAKLIYYYQGYVGNGDAEVFAKANEIIKTEINATVDFRPLLAGEYNQKMTLIINAGEEYDLSQSGGLRQPYVANALKGAYYPIDSLLDEYGSWFKANIPSGLLEGCKVNGKTYAVPNYQSTFRQNGIVMQKDIVDKYKIDISNIKKMSDLGPVFETVKKNEPEMICTLDQFMYPDKFYWTLDEFMEFPVHAGFPLLVDGSLNVVNKLKDKRIADEYYTMREFYNKGYYPQDIATIKNPAEIKMTGKVFSGFVSVKPGAEAQAEIQFGGKKVYVVPVAMTVADTYMVTATLTAINYASKNPERSMMFLNLLNSNKVLNNILFFGIDGRDYVKVDSNRINRVEKPTYNSYQWCIGSQFNAYLLPEQADDVWEETKKMNEDATPSFLMGFVFDTSTVKSEIAAISALEFGPILGWGQTDDIEGTLKKWSDKCDAAGIQKVSDELQKQIDSWKKTKQ